MSLINIASWNSNALRHKLHELTNFINKYNIDICLINETKLTNKDHLKLRNYTINRRDRPLTNNHKNAAGGVAVLIKNNIPHTRLRTISSNIENVVIRLATNTHIIAAYNEPANKLTQTDLYNLTHTFTIKQ